MALNRGFTYRWQIGPRATGQPLLAHLTAAFAHSDSAVWSARLSRGEVTVDGAPACADEPVRQGQQLTWARPPWDEPDVPLQFDVVHDDAAIIVVAKPSGLPTMPAGGFLEHTLLRLVRGRFGDAHPAHRLGRGTSGLVVFARSRVTAAALGAAWRNASVLKRYRALISGDPAWTSCPITTPIGPVPHTRLGTVHAATPDGRDAISAATVVERRQGATLCDVGIVTGRPHQIRIHMAAVGHPLVGDPLYRSGGLPLDDALPGDGGYLLHAHVLAFPHPASGDHMTFEALPPPELRTAAERG